MPKRCSIWDSSSKQPFRTTGDFVLVETRRSSELGLTSVKKPSGEPLEVQRVLIKITSLRLDSSTKVCTTHNNAERQATQIEDLEVILPQIDEINNTEKGQARK